jgi:hypothetical protein
MQPAYRLTDLAPGLGGTPRVLHGLAVRAPHRFAQRVAQVGWEVSRAAVLDRLAPLRGRMHEVAEGCPPSPGGALGLYLHWSPDGRISAMVRRQVALWREAGFTMVFITNASPPAGDWAAIAEHAALRIRRANVGRDFGASRDGAAAAVPRFGLPREVLLANDSVLGPFLPFPPLAAALRAGGEGLFGLTESWGGGPHLQSYALLARGPAAVDGLLAHLLAFRDTRSKWLVVRQGEIGLSQRMRALGVRRASLFPYAGLVAGVLPETRAMLGPRFADGAGFDRFPLNPCHHFWRELLAQGFPYLKTELVRHNPGQLAGVADWPRHVPAELLPMLRDHLRLLGGGG